MTITVSGDILFDKKEIIPVLTLYRPSDTNPLHFVPKFDQHCICRAFIGGLSSCAKRPIFKWYCNKLKQQVDPKTCNSCQVVEHGK